MHSLFGFGAFVFTRDLHSERLASIIVHFVLCTVHRVHLHCATVLWLVYYAQRDNEGTTKGQQNDKQGSQAHGLKLKIGRLRLET